MKNKQRRSKRKGIAPPVGKEKTKARAKAYPTHNAEVIAKLMDEYKVKGKFKDHVVIVGSQLMDWQGTYQISKFETGEKIGINAMAIVHKSKLVNIIGDEAKRFWHKGIGRVQAK